MKRILLILFIIFSVRVVNAQMVTSYYEGGDSLNPIVEYQGVLKDSVRQGEWVFNYPNGAEWRTLNYNKGELDGVMKV